MLVTSKTRKTDPLYDKIARKITKVNALLKATIDPCQRAELLSERTDLYQQRRRCERTTTNVKDWETRTPKEVRSNVLRDLEKGYIVALENLKRGNIKHFRLKHRKGEDCKSITLQPNQIAYSDGFFTIAPRHMRDKMKDESMSKFLISKRGRKNLEKESICINNDVRIIKERGQYFVCILLGNSSPESPKVYTNVVGIDGGLRRFATCFDTTNQVTEIQHPRHAIKKLNMEIKKLKKVGCRKKAITKREKRKAHLMDDCHWKSINYLLDNYDVVLFGDIKSHGIVNRPNSNKYINQEFNDVKFYQFKQRLSHKAKLRNKIVVLVNEGHTTKTCTECGFVNHEIGTLEQYRCPQCKLLIDRDVNSGKAILMKGMLTNRRWLLNC